MSEQQPTGYGIPYAMHIHDIELIIECNNGTAVNKRLEEGCILLAITNEGCTDVNWGGLNTNFIMGKPRAKYCSGAFRPHKPTRLHYNHDKKEWLCLVEGCESC